MKIKIFVLVLILLLVAVFGTQCAVAGSESLDSRMTIYVVPPITDVKILPTSYISSSYISDEISIIASPGEYEPASFVVRALDDISSLIVEATELTGESGRIPSDNIDIRVVKCWYQAGEDIQVGGGHQKLLTPELLLKDDSLVKIEGGENYLTLTTREYVWISERASVSGHKIIPIEDLPVKDSSTLQPVDIPGGTNKQFWVTIKVPDGCLSGPYDGRIELRTSDGSRGELQLKLEVLPIELSKPYLTYSIYYRGKLKESGSISSENKNEEQFRAEMENLLNHGVVNPTVYQDSDELGEALTIRNSAGLDNQPLYYLGVATGNPTSSAGLEALTDRVKRVIEIAKPYGVTEVYFYGIDEAKGELLALERPAWQAVHDVGGKVFVAGYPGTADIVGDLLDLLILSGWSDSHVSEINQFHSHGHKVFSYGNPQVGEQKPETYRRNYGLLLWQMDYDGAMDYAYQASFGNIWNDFDHSVYRDHVFAYPTIDGVIDTVQWEGWREGVDDIRYLTTLLELIEEAKVSTDTSAIESWLADLKSSDLTKKDLHALRSDMIDHILYLLGEEPTEEPTPEYDPSSFTFNATEGAANLATQTLSIWNSGSGTLGWLVSGDAAWLTLSPSSGTSTGETDDVTVSVDISGMGAGRYSATITISAPGATNTPHMVPVSLNINPTPTPGGGGGGGGGGGEGGGIYQPQQATELIVDMWGKVTSGDRTPLGVLLETIEAISADEVVTLLLDQGTTVVDYEGDAVAKIRVDPIALSPSLPAPPQGHIIDAYNFIPRCEFDPSVVLTILYDEEALAGVDEQNLVIEYYNRERQEWAELPTVVDTWADTVTASIDHFTVFAVVAVPHPELTLAGLLISPTEVYPGESLDISVLVINSGDATGSRTVELRIEGEVEDSQEVALASGDSETITFTVTRDEPGTYRVAVGGLAGEFVVVAVPVVSTGFWVVVWSVVALLVIAGAIALYFWRWRPAYSESEHTGRPLRGGR